MKANPILLGRIFKDSLGFFKMIGNILIRYIEKDIGDVLLVKDILKQIEES